MARSFPGKSSSMAIVAMALFCMHEGVADDDAPDRKPNASVVSSDERDYRQPIDLALSSDERMLAVANQKTGDIYVWDIASKTIVQHLPVAKGLVDLQPISDDRLVAVSHDEDRLILFRWNANKLEPIDSIATAKSPIRAEWIGEQSLLRVAALWSHQVETFDFSSNSQGSSPKVSRVALWDIPFAPRHLLTLQDPPMTLVADAFGTHMCLVDNKSGRLLGHNRFLGHAICGLQRSKEGMIAVAHASVNDFAETTQNDIHWGVLLANDLRWLDPNRLLAETREEAFGESKIQPVGVPGNGGAELTSLYVSQEGFSVITVGGTDQLAIGQRSKSNFRYVPVGRHPVSVIVAESTQMAFVANKFEDSISIVDLRRARLVDSLWMGKIRALTDEEKGEKLFHDASLSHDRWMTCASCHVDGHTNGLLTDNLGDRNYGAAKRVVSLLGNGNTAPYSWLGLEPTLHAQIVRSVEKTMQSYRKLDQDEVAHLAAYCESLKAPPSIAAARQREDAALVEQGREIFVRQNCVDCHLPPTYTTPDKFDVGLKDQKGAKLFNPPSLRGLSQRGPNYFHDNRAEGIRASWSIISIVLKSLSARPTKRP